MFKSQFIETFESNNNRKMKNIANVAEVIAGGDKPKDYSEVKTDEYSYPVYANGIDNEGLQRFSREYRVDKGAVTISARGTIGATFIREPYFTPIVRLIAIIPKEKIDAIYLKYAIDLLGVSGNGSSQQQLTIPNVKKVKIPVADIETQERFADIVRQSDKSKLLKQIDVG